jgi:hypothetical protein
MTFAALFSQYWWLMFPIFGMGMAVLGMFQDDSRSRKTMDLIKSYVDQGKEPPPELLKLATQDADSAAWRGDSKKSDGAWTFIVFAGVSAGLGTGYYFVRAEDYAFAFLIGAVATGVMAVGALVLLISGRRS